MTSWTELCQAQGKFKSICFGSLDLIHFVWQVWLVSIGRFGLVDFGWFVVPEVVFIFDVVFVVDVIFIFVLIFRIEVVFIFEAVLIF